MLKIHKCISLSRRLPLVSTMRGMCYGDKCPPRYECKQPEPDEFEKQLEELRELDKPTIYSMPCGGNPKLWRRLFAFVCVPAIICLFVNVFFVAHEKFRRPKFIEFSYMRIRNKPYPWDPVRTLIHNPRVNALPTGYEVEVPEEEEYDPFEPDKK